MDGAKYLFVAYSEADYEEIDNILLELYKRGMPVKAEKDIEPAELDTVICEATAVMFVISHNSVVSKDIAYQIELALQFHKSIIPYYLCEPEHVNLPRNLFGKMDGSATIPAYEYALEENLVHRVIDEVRPYFPEVFMRRKKQASLGPILGVCVIICTCILAYFLWVQPKVQENAILEVRNATVQIYAVEDEEVESYDTGSGFFVSESGLIATNYHVIDEAEYLLIVPSTEDEFFWSTIVDYDEESDLALLQIEDYLPESYLHLSNKDIGVGDSIYVSGYPRGIDLIVSNGIISNSGHYAEGENAEYYLITAAISPGNSGGPVVDTSGKVVGVATAKYTDAENLNLIRPVSYLKELLER